MNRSRRHAFVCTIVVIIGGVSAERVIRQVSGTVPKENAHDP